MDLDGGFGGWGALKIPCSMEPVQSEFLSVFARAQRSALISRTFGVVLRLTDVKAAESSMKPEALNHPQAASLGPSPDSPSAITVVYKSDPLGDQTGWQRSYHWCAHALISRSAYALKRVDLAGTGARPAQRQKLDEHLGHTSNRLSRPAFRPQVHHPL